MVLGAGSLCNHANLSPAGGLSCGDNRRVFFSTFCPDLGNTALVEGNLVRFPCMLWPKKVFSGQEDRAGGCVKSKRELGSYPQVLQQTWNTGTLDYWTPLYLVTWTLSLPPKLEVNRLLVKRMTVGQVCGVDEFEVRRCPYHEMLAIDRGTLLKDAGWPSTSKRLFDHTSNFILHQLWVWLHEKF